MAKCAIAVFMLLSAELGTLSAQDCLHGPAEQPAQRARRQDALKIAHQINLAEAISGRVGEYRPLAGLVNVSPAPSGFQVRLLTDGVTYTFSIKDTLDPCRYAIFSDEDGRIYQGYPTSEVIVLPAKPAKNE